MPSGEDPEHLPREPNAPAPAAPGQAAGAFVCFTCIPPQWGRGYSPPMRLGGPMPTTTELDRALSLTDDAASRIDDAETVIAAIRELTERIKAGNINRD